MSLNAGLQDYTLDFQINATDLPANTDQNFISPVDGYISALRTVVQAAVTTGGTIAVKTGDALAVTVAGLTQTIANAAAVGARQTTTATAKSLTRKVSKGDRIALDLTSFATAGAINGSIFIKAADTDGVMPF
ncbi:hypothetical protein ACQZ6C_10790 [Rhizobium rhizogenes]